MNDYKIVKQMKEFIRDSCGCMFAARLVRNWERANWKTAVLSGPDAGKAVTNILQPIDNAEVGLLIFPDIKTPEDVCKLIAELPQPCWKRIEINWEPMIEPKALLVGIQWVLPDPRYVTWAMGMGSFAVEMPPMRRAPFTVIAVRVRGHRAIKKTITHIDGRELVTFGDVPTLLEGDTKLRDAYFKATKEQKRELLAGHMTEPMSKRLGQVAFSLPLQYRSQLFND